MTRLEVMMQNLGSQISRELEVASRVHESIDRSVATLTELVARQDARIGAVERSMARAVGAVAVIVLLVNLLAPVLRGVLGLPQ